MAGNLANKCPCVPAATSQHVAAMNTARQLVELHPAGKSVVVEEEWGGKRHGGTAQSSLC